MQSSFVEELLSRDIPVSFFIFTISNVIKLQLTDKCASRDFEKSSTSSRYTRQHLSSSPPRTSFIMRWNVAGLFVKPKVMTFISNKSQMRKLICALLTFLLTCTVRPSQMSTRSRIDRTCKLYPRSWALDRRLLSLCWSGLYNPNTIEVNRPIFLTNTSEVAHSDFDGLLIPLSNIESM